MRLRYIGHCQVTGKVMYSDRRTAAQAARRHPDHMNPYCCDACRYWHIGHLAPGIIRGRITRGDRYRPVSHACDDQTPEIASVAAEAIGA